jgi:integral membrane protein
MLVLKSAVGRVRAAGFVEGCSALLLFFVAMPLKYIAKHPSGTDAVFWVGAIHGGLFLLYAAVAFWAWGKGHLSDKLLGYAALASIVPFGPFVIDRKLKEAEKPQPDNATAVR